MNAATSKAETPSKGTVSGFNKATNRKVSLCGIDFSFPSYFDVDKSTATEKHFYPEEKEYYASLQFFYEDLSVTQQDFDRQIIIPADNLMRKVDENVKILKSEKIKIAGMSGYLQSYKTADSTVCFAYVYNLNMKKLVVIYLAHDDKDQSNYDYSGDFVKILETANLSTETPTATNASWKEMLNEYEAWVDLYVALMKKYKAKPNDLTLLSDYMTMLIQLSEWPEKLDSIKKDKLTKADYVYYIETMARITSKLASVMP